MEPLVQSARVVFGPSVPGSPEGADDVQVQIIRGTYECEGVIELENIAHIHVIAYASCHDKLSFDGSRLDISRVLALRSLTLEIVFDTLDNACVIGVWAAILALVRSIPENSQLEKLTLTSPVSHAVLRSAWSQSDLVRALKRPLYTLDKRLVELVDRAPLRAVTLTPPRGEKPISTDWVRVSSLFPALREYGMLEF